jgi:hypothetical protein
MFGSRSDRIAALNNGEQTVQRPNDHDEIDPEFLEEVKKYGIVILLPFDNHLLMPSSVEASRNKQQTT